MAGFLRAMTWQRVTCMHGRAPPPLSPPAICVWCGVGRCRPLVVEVKALHSDQGRQRLLQLLR